MRKIPPLNALKAFEAAGRHLNFRRAAEELGVTQGAVAQQVRRLEEQLGLALFERHARGLVLTDAGRRYLPLLRRAFDLMAEATDGLAPDGAVVTISTTPSLATRWLVPRLGAFAQSHPDIRIRLEASNALANFQSDGVDIAIRRGVAPFGPGLVAHRLLQGRLIAVCQPALARGAAPIRSAADLCRHVLLEDAHGQWPLFLEAALGTTPQGLRMMSFSQTSLAIDAAIAGQGVALATPEFVEDELRSGRLCQPIAATVRTPEDHYIVAPRSPHKPRLVAILRDWLLSAA